MLETINEVLSKIDGIVWGVPLMVLILSGGLYVLHCRQRSEPETL